MTPADSLREAVLDRLAAGWITLGASLGGPKDQTLLDPEALVVMTALHGRDEPRLYDGALDWCVAYGTLVNGARLRTVAREIGGDPTSVQHFAALVAGGGGPRWPVLTVGPTSYQSRGKVQVRDMSEPGALTVRLRALFGVAVRADILAVLATSSGSAPSLAELATVTRSSKRSIALAVDTLRLGGAVEVDRVGNQQRVRLSTDPGFRAWLNAVPVGVDWATRFTVIEAVLQFHTSAPAQGIAWVVEARVLAERLVPLARRSSLPAPALHLQGLAFADAFDRWQWDLTAATRPQMSRSRPGPTSAADWSNR